jgi:hypothetical protein
VKRLLSLTPLALVAAACGATNPAPLGNLLRPSGILYVPREPSIDGVQNGLNNGNLVDRADIYIADSLQQGIRILQLGRKIGVTLTSTSDDSWYVPAPIEFFPLVVPAEGFPTRLKMSKTSSATIYALSTGSEMLFVIDAKAVPFGGTFAFNESAVDTNNIVAQFSLADLVPEHSTPVALAVGASSSGDDVVFIALEVPSDRTTGAALAAIQIHKNADGSFMRVQGAEPPQHIQPAPSDMVLRDDGLLVITSADENGDSTMKSFTVVQTSPKVPYIANVATLSAGGPTIGVIDAKKQGVVMLRLDRASAVLFDVVTSSAGSELRRSTRMIASPYTTEFDLHSGNPDLLGRIDLPISPTGEGYPPQSGAYGTMRCMWDQPTTPVTGVLPLQYLPIGGVPTQFSCTSPGLPSDDVVEITQLNGRGVVLYGHPLRLAVTNSQPINTSTVPVLTRLVIIRAPAMPDGTELPAGPVIEGCTVNSALVDQLKPLCTLASGTVTSTIPPVCAAPSFKVNYGVYIADTLRATYQGDLAYSRFGVLQLASRDPNGDAHFILTDSSINPLLQDGFTDRQIRPGDSALLQLRFPCNTGACALGSVNEASEVGMLEQVANFSQLQIMFPANSIIASRWPYTDATQVGIAVYEIYPSNTDSVLTSVTGLVVNRVLERVPTTIDAMGDHMHFSKSRVTMTITSTAPFSCHEQRPPPSQTGTASIAVGCQLNTDCPSGNVCEPQNGQLGCFAFCSATCDPTMSSCVSAEILRLCTGIELAISPLTASTPTFQAPNGFLPAIPDQTVFSPLFQGFITSFPGSRGLSIIKADPTDGFLPVQFR